MLQPGSPVTDVTPTEEELRACCAADAWLARVQAARPIPSAKALPDLSDGPHLSYAVQWIFFAGVAIVGFVVLIRRESEYAAAEEALTAAETSSGTDAVD